jgi:hypothetical protein
MTGNTMITEQPISKMSLIAMYEKTYRDALSVIDNEVKDLIQNGQEMKGLFLNSKNISKIMEVHEALTSLYILVFNSQDVLKKYDSKRYKQTGQKDLKPILELVKIFDGAEEKKEKHIIDGLREVGFLKYHPFISTLIISELEYMIKTLQIIVEPDFELPHEAGDESEEMPD